MRAFTVDSAIHTASSSASTPGEISTRSYLLEPDVRCHDLILFVLRTKRSIVEVVSRRLRV